MASVIFDMDGVLASVGRSYNLAIERTAFHFGAEITQEEINTEKKKGNANNDWILSQRLIKSKINKDLTLVEVTEVFERFYQGTETTSGLCCTETLIPARGILEEIVHRVEGRVAVVTGRPRKDCLKFLQQHNLQDMFKICVCMGEAESKPSPAGVLLACRQLGVDPSLSIMLGDTPDDVRAGKSAGGKAYGIITPEEEAEQYLGVLADSDGGMKKALLGAGADGVLRPGLGELLEILPRLNTSMSPSVSSSRTGSVERKTGETQIRVLINLDGTGRSEINTGLGFFDHMICQLAKHGRFDITLKCTGDLHVDDHHTMEDCALALGEAFDLALGRREGIQRFGDARCPLDESLSEAVVDISSRPFSVIDLKFDRERIGDVSCEMLVHALQSFAQTARITLHVHCLHGVNNHHKAESAFKALAVALRRAVSKDVSAGIPSTKGVLA